MPPADPSTEAVSTSQDDAIAGVVLILEDEPMTALMVQKAVTERGFAVAGPFARQEDALEALDALGGRPVTAALLDVSLRGGATSAPVADVLAQRDIPFAFVTGYGPETGVVASAFPDRLVIPKPVDQATVGLILDELLRPR